MRDPRSAVVELNDGTTASSALALPFPHSSRVARYDYLPASRVVQATTERGDVIEYEVPPGDPDTHDPVAGRPVVYLDQNQWSAVSNALHGTGRTAAEDVEAALRLVELATERVVILPVSAGHLMETSQWTNDDRRYQLGITVASLSRGWYMRDPLRVRRDELRRLFLRRYRHEAEERPTLPVFTLDPDVAFAATIGPERPASRESQPDDILRVLTSVVSAIDLLLDAEDTQPGPETGWVAANQAFIDGLHTSTLDGRQKRSRIDAWLLQDLQHDVDDAARVAGTHAHDSVAWLDSSFGDDLAHLQSLAWYREVLHARHLDPRTTWEPNDLIDMVFLSCAAAYADVVVCERHLAEPLHQAARRLRRSDRAYARLREAVPVVEAYLRSSTR